MLRPPPISTLFPYTTLFRSELILFLATLKYGLSSSVEAASAVSRRRVTALRSEEHTSELQSRGHLVCRLLLEKKNATGASWFSSTNRRAPPSADRAGSARWS